MAVYSLFTHETIVMFHSYVSLPEGTHCKVKGIFRSALQSPHFRSGRRRSRRLRRAICAISQWYYWLLLFFMWKFAEMGVPLVTISRLDFPEIIQLLGYPHFWKPPYIPIYQPSWTIYGNPHRIWWCFDVVARSPTIFCPQDEQERWDAHVRPAFVRRLPSPGRCEPSKKDPQMHGL